VLNDRVPGTGACQLRVTHAALNKDNGLIDPATGRATDPRTPRGMVGDNFAKAVSGAITESRRQWQDFGSDLVDRYGRDKGRRMICALTRDDPVHDCRGWATSSVVAVVVGGGLLLAAVVTFVWLVRRPFRPTGRPGRKPGRTGRSSWSRRVRPAGRGTAMSGPPDAAG